ncbi:MAG: MBL fold metallo-hydrolase [Balneolaceae bacterium]
MQIGEFTVEQLSEGFFELHKNGDLVKLDPARLNQPEDDPLLGKHSSALGIDPLLVIGGSTVLVADAGLGWGLDAGSRHKNTSNLITNLDIFGIRPQDVTTVFLSHLHYDHAAGCTYVSDTSETTITFPNAVYLAHADEWEFAVECHLNQPADQAGARYNLDELFRLKANGQLQLIDSDRYSIARGLTGIKTGGHTPGHMILTCESDGEGALFTGDLIPTEYHLNQYATRLVDYNPVEAKKAKTLLVREAFKKQWQLFFYHSLYGKNGKLARDKHKNYVLVQSKS